MSLNGWLQIAVTLALVLAVVLPLGRFMARLFMGERTFLHPVLSPVERGFYRAAGIDPAREQGWFSYTMAMLVFSAAGFVSLYAILRLQGVLPFNPAGLPGCGARPGLQHGDQLCDQHQLAGLFRRKHYEQFQPDGRA